MPIRKFTDSHRRRAVLLGLLLVAALGFYWLHSIFDIAHLDEIIERWQLIKLNHPALSVISFVLLYICIVAFSLPGALIMSLTGGFLFGALWGSLINMTSASLGALAVFFMVRWGMLGQEVISQTTSGQRIYKIKKAIEVNEIKVLFLLRFLPIVPFFLANILPAIWGVAWQKYALTTVLGILPATIIITSIGAQANKIMLTSGAFLDDGLFNARNLFVLFGLAFLVALPMILKPLRKKLGV